MSLLFLHVCGGGGGGGVCVCVCVYTLLLIPQLQILLLSGKEIPETHDISSLALWRPLQVEQSYKFNKT